MIKEASWLTWTNCVGLGSALGLGSAEHFKTDDEVSPRLILFGREGMRNMLSAIRSPTAFAASDVDLLVVPPQLLVDGTVDAQMRIAQAIIVVLMSHDQRQIQ